MIAVTRKAPPGVDRGGAPKNQSEPANGYFHCTATIALCKGGAKIAVDPLLESTVRTLQALGPRGRELVAIMVRQLAAQEGITVPESSAMGLKEPAEGIPLWVAKLKQESFSKRTIGLYLPTVENYLKRDPTPTKLSIQQWLASRLESVSTAEASNDRKALRSFFKFLHEEGLWPADPTAGLKAIKVRYRAKEIPEPEDIQKLLQYECHRAKDTPKFRTMLILLITTGLRVTEAASILKKNIDFNRREIKVIGKGGKEGVVPLLSVTADALKRYIDEHNNGSPQLFPGDNPLGYWNVSSIEKNLKRACAKLGIKKVAPHQLRHYFATYALREGAKLEVISKILRHASAATTLDLYRHVLTEEMHETAERFAPLSRTPLALSEGRKKEVKDDNGDR